MVLGEGLSEEALIFDGDAKHVGGVKMGLANIVWPQFDFEG